MEKQIYHFFSEHSVYFHAPDLRLPVFHTSLMASNSCQRGAPLFTPQSIDRHDASDQGCGV